MQIDTLKAHIIAIENTVTVLEKELRDSGASRGSARKGRNSQIKAEVEKFMAQRRARQIKKGLEGK